MISGILQVFHRFLITALSPLLYNLGIIIGILFFVPAWGLAGLAWGVVLGGVLHLSVQLPALFVSGFKYRLSFNLKDPGILKKIKLMDRNIMKIFQIYSINLIFVKNYQQSNN